MKRTLLLLSFLTAYCSGIFAQDSQSLSDNRDEQIYNIVKIGEQLWMAQNLNFETEGSWCYDNNVANCGLYGRLYTAASAQNACPAGWRLPTDSDWESLLQNTAPKHMAGGMLKDNSSTFWTAPNTGADNSSGFSALPAGYKLRDGSFSGLGTAASFWSVFDDNSGIWGRHLSSESARFNTYSNPQHEAYSVRCVK